MLGDRISGNKLLLLEILMAQLFQIRANLGGLFR
jgi:hypothetical protein